MPQIIFYEAFKEEELALKACAPPGLDAVFTAATIQESGHSLPPARIVSIRTQSDIPAEWSKCVDAIISRSTGYDHILRFLARAGNPVPCGYLPEYCARSVAEHAMTMWQMLLRRVPQQIRQFARFDRDGLTGRESRGRKLVVVGVGRIGIEIVRLGQALEMQVYGVDIEEKHANVNYVSIEEALPLADVLVCAMNLTKENASYFNASRWERVKNGVVFVNIARGELSPLKDLVQALDQGCLGGLGLDVYEDEPQLGTALRSGSPGSFAGAGILSILAERPDTVLTPHNAFNTVEAIERKAFQTIEQVSGFLTDGTLIWPVPGFG
ncbi:MAG: hydroxyacid dehydrogenase [Verrucomicrobia bacterium]|nr:hydroxyacid dehydrogenase [Verrucomicrobiota bacterium]